MPGKGIIVVSPNVRPDGPWLDATRATSLQRVANRPIICHVLDELVAAEVDEIAVLTPPNLAEEITSCIEDDGSSTVKTHCLAYDCRAEPASALCAITEFAGQAPTILHRADGLLGQPLAPFLALLEEDRSADRGRAADQGRTEDRDRTDMVVLVAQGARNAEPLGPAAQRMLRVAEFDPAKAALGLAGVCVLAPGALGHLSCDETFSGELTLGVIAESLLTREDSRVHTRVVREWRAFAGDTRDLLDMNRAVLDTLDDPISVSQNHGNRFEGRVFIDPTASVTSSVICGPVIVGAGARVADSYIGPHTSIGEGVHVEGAEIERSIVFAGASILHLGGRLVASVVGREARVFRDFSMPRAMRLQVGDGDEVALC